MSGAALNDCDLGGWDLESASFVGAKFDGARLSGARFRGANFSNAYLKAVDLSDAYLEKARFTHADLRAADLSRADLRSADMVGARLDGARLVGTLLGHADLSGCSVYGISAWNLVLDETRQSDLIITPGGEPTITVDNIDLAQFLYLLLTSEKIREVIDTITSKAVLILGRFTPERQAVLAGIRDALRQRGYLPILFDFEGPSTRDLTETVSILAHMARFIIADITDAKSVAQELQAIVPHLPSVPVQPIMSREDREYGMFEHFARYPWVLSTYVYDNLDGLVAALDERVITPAEARLKEVSDGH